MRLFQGAIKTTRSFQCFYKHLTTELNLIRISIVEVKKKVIPSQYNLISKPSLGYNETNMELLARQVVERHIRPVSSYPAERHMFDSGI